MSGLWELFASHLEKNGCLHPEWQVLHRPSMRDLTVPPCEVGKAVEEQNWTGFFISTRFSQNKEIMFRLEPMYPSGAPRPSQGYSLTLTYQDGAVVPDNWDAFIIRCLDSYLSFGATLTATRYMAWQCTPILDGYETRYGPLPPGFRRIIKKCMDGMEEDRIFLDTSMNPGRYVLDDKNQFRAVTADLWLGAHFWDYAPCTKEAVLASDIFLEKRDTPHYLYLKSWPHPFTRPDGEQGRVQQKLWRLLFKEDCEWPP